MGTRSIITFKEDGQTLCSIYQQWDGYPTGVGLELAEFLKSKELVNGISGDRSTVFNGAGCLVAQYIAKHKTEAGSFYITKPDAVFEEFNYVVDIKFLTWGAELDNSCIKVSCDAIKGGKLLSIDKFIKKISKWGQ